MKLVKKKKLIKKVEEPKELIENVKENFTNLRGVMDYSRPLSIFYSGVEHNDGIRILYDLGIRNFLMSYEYLKGKGAKVFKDFPDIKLFIDSGAYTYQNDPKYEDYTNEQWEEQIVKYLDWARKHKDNIFTIADLDLQYLKNVGYDKVYEWREKYFEPFMLETGIPVCFIYHEDGLDYWEYMCKRYPYVGLSLAIDKVENGSAQLKQMFKIAEKHNTLCQGMASTDTNMLTKYPFYTVDSTTWNVGLRFGEISVWKDNKMTRLKKKDWETKLPPMISFYEEDFDIELILKEDRTEVSRINAYAFVLAEKYVQERLKAKMYWLKNKTKKVDIENLPDDFFPTPDWFDGDTPQNVKEYAEKMNINLEYENVFEIIAGMTAFLNWDNPDYGALIEQYRNNDYDLVKESHNLFVNRIVPDNETRISDLVNFYTECLKGDNDTLIIIGTDFDRIIREREDYIEEGENFDLVDISLEEIKDRVSRVLPSPEDVKDSSAPEISELDAEIFAKVDVVPTFDEKGRFVKGQTKVRKPKNLYSEKYPKMSCDTCFVASNCPEYKSGFVCAYDKMFKRFDVRDSTTAFELVEGMINYQSEKLQKEMLQERITGTNSADVNTLMSQQMGMINQYMKMRESGLKEGFTQTRTVGSDGTVRESVEINNPQNGGILEKIFMKGKD